jgi:DNA-binding NarL/FixJ family response regulator
MGNCGPVLVVDDDRSLRELASTLLRRAGLETREAARADEALRLAEAEPPSVALIDVKLEGGTSGYELCRELRDRFGDSLAIVFVSGTRTETFDRVAGFLIGADDYIVKPFEPDELIARVRRFATRTASAAGATARESSQLDALTRREREVLELLVRGLDQKAIANALVLSPKTVATHIQSVLEKLQVHSRAQAVAKAHVLGMSG